MTDAERIEALEGRIYLLEDLLRYLYGHGRFSRTPAETGPPPDIQIFCNKKRNLFQAAMESTDPPPLKGRSQAFFRGAEAEIDFLFDLFPDPRQ